MPIEIVEYDPSWPAQFSAAAAAIRGALGSEAAAIHHIGSSSVPGLAAKDIIDIQITVAGLNDEIAAAMTDAGFVYREDLLFDHQPPGAGYSESELAKMFFVEQPGARLTNIHARVEGAFNQRYAVLFRDYLRAHHGARDAYGELKKTLARLFPDDVESYYQIKDPAIDMLMAGANVWAHTTGWQVPPSDA